MQCGVMSMRNDPGLRDDRVSDMQAKCLMDMNETIGEQKYVEFLLV